MTVDDGRTMASLPPTTRGALGYLLATGLVVGAWALGWPRAFYDSFPGFGHAWVSPDGPYNGHLVRDVGAAYLTFAALAGLALVRPGRVTPSAVGFATLVFNVAHLAYHATHLAMYAPVDRALNVAALGAAALCSAWLLTPRAQGNDARR